MGYKTERKQRALVKKLKEEREVERDKELKKAYRETKVKRLDKNGNNKQKRI